MEPRQLLERIRQGHRHNIRFQDFRRLIEALGYRLARSRGSHQVFVHSRTAETFPIQPVGGQAKPYQVRQLLQLVHRYNLQIGKETP